MKEISPRELAERMKSEHPPRLIDVREPDEWQVCRIEGSELKPLMGIYSWMSELQPDEPVVLICHHGNRSAQAAMFLAHQGFREAINLRGGVEAWSREVDPGMPRY